MHKQFLTYASCAQLLKTGKSKIDSYPAKKLGSNIYLYFDGEKFCVNYLSTNVLVISKTEWVIRACHMHIQKKIDCINKFAPVTIHKTGWGTWFKLCGKNHFFSCETCITQDMLVEHLL